MISRNRMKVLEQVGMASSEQIIMACCADIAGQVRGKGFPEIDLPLRLQRRVWPMARRRPRRAVRSGTIAVLTPFRFKCGFDNLG